MKEVELLYTLGRTTINGQSVYTTFPCLEHLLFLLYKYARPSYFRMALNHIQSQTAGSSLP